MKLLEAIAHFFATWEITDKLGIGAGLMYNHIAGNALSEEEFQEQKLQMLKDSKPTLLEAEKFLGSIHKAELKEAFYKLEQSTRENYELYCEELTQKCKELEFFMFINDSLDTLKKDVTQTYKNDVDLNHQIEITSQINQIKECTDHTEAQLRIQKLFNYIQAETSINLEETQEFFSKLEEKKRECFN